jgi:23S rRNA pseudouridine1911/1915/1917 synthase
VKVAADARFVIEADAGGQRLDAVVSARLGLSRAAGRRLVASGRVRVDGRNQPKGAVVAGGAVVTVTAEGATGAAAEGIAPDDPGAAAVVYEDDALIAIDKPAGMPSHPLRPGERGTAANLIIAHAPECATASPDPREGGLGHRLDTATSGVLMAARTRQAWLGLRAALGGPGCEKRYLAEVWGSPPDEEGQVDTAIGRRGRRGKTVRLDSGRNPQPAHTAWRVLERRGPTTLVEARLHAGRPHQVRAHLAAAGFPIVGDDRYGRERPERAGVAGAPPLAGDPVHLHLHAASVTFTHPATGALLTVSAPSPRWAEVQAPGGGGDDDGVGPGDPESIPTR